MRSNSDETKALIERIKELNCLYGISRLFSRSSLRLEVLLQEIAAMIPKAWQYPDRTCARISHNGRMYRSKNFNPGGESMVEAIKLKKRKIGFVEVAYHAKTCDGNSGFLDEESKLLKAIAELLGNILEKKEAEVSLERTTADLLRQTVELENKNIALREIISQIEMEKKAIQDQIRLNIDLTVLPLLNRIEVMDAPPEVRNNYLKVARQNLSNITSSFTQSLTRDSVKLSPRELEISNLIKNGLSNKEIAALLRIALPTVERHRHNIRKKLNIDNKKMNLATMLRDL